jgi:uncharacterized repeat protein (TIGR03803 family)
MGSKRIAAACAFSATKIGPGIAAFALALLTFGAQMAAAQEITLYSFKGSNSSDGSVPVGGLIFDSAGNLYGTTNSGGSVGAPYDIYGTVFELSPGTGGNWTEKVLYSFGATGADGIQPTAGLIFDSAGNLYGTTRLGGANGNGTVFELSPSAGGTWTETVLYSFGATADDAAEPHGSLIFDSAGNLYGTTFIGGPHKVLNGAGEQAGGTVFELSPTGKGGWKEKVLYSFGLTAMDAANPGAGLVMDGAGDLYGTTVYGGKFNSGTAFELVRASGGTWKEKVLHSFDDNGVDGSLPEVGLIFDAQGNLYGTTYGGGSNPYSGGLGAVFELSPSPGGTWTEDVLFSFGGLDGTYPLGSLVFDAAGNLYGTASSQLYGFGLLFELTPGTAGWSEKAVYTFGDTPDGHVPEGGLVFDSRGNLYGADSTGGAEAADFGLGGTIYEVPSVTAAAPAFSPAGGAYTAAQSVKITDSTHGATIYYTTDGSTPTTSSAKYTGQIEVSASEIVNAIAVAKGVPQSFVATATYLIGAKPTAAQPEFSPADGFYPAPPTVTLTDATPGATIHFTTDGQTPTTASTKYTGPITVSTSETIEAIAVAPGHTDSVVSSSSYAVAPGPLPTEKILYNFGATAKDGDVPFAGLISDSAGNLYGTTEYGGPNMAAQGDSTVTAGTVFELSPTAGGGWTKKTLYNFGANSTDGTNPLGSLAIDTKGNLYGTTSGGGSVADGTVFELSPGANGAWTEKVIHNFVYLTNDGTSPRSGLTIDAKGNLYGTTYAGGANSEGSSGPGGTVFELSPAAGGKWTEKLLYSFNYLKKTDGYYPVGGVVFDAKGNLYGTTSDGGAAQDSQGGGTVFELSPAAGGKWTEKVLASFGGGSTTIGYQPLGNLAVDAAGNVYGTVNSGGNGFGLDGTVFELSPSADGTWTQSVIHSFGAYEADGINSRGGLVFDAKGNIYGTTVGGGENNFGTLFELAHLTGGGWAEQVLHNFDLSDAPGTADPDGATPYAGVHLDATGNIYGTTGYGGAHGGSDSGTTGGTVFEIESATTTQEPVFSPAAGTYSAEQKVKITDATADAVIYYTTNGATPTTSSHKYTGAIPVTETETIKAIAVSADLADSVVASATYKIEPLTAKPIISPAAGKYSTAKTITITDATAGAIIHYTTDGTTPTAASTKYTGAIKLSKSATVNAIAIAPSHSESAVASAVYDIE